METENIDPKDVKLARAILSLIGREVKEETVTTVELANEVAGILGVSMAASILERAALKIGAIDMTEVYLFSVVIGAYVLTRVFIWVKKW